MSSRSSPTITPRGDRPHGAAIRRRTDKDSQVSKPNSARAAGAGGSSSTMLKLYTDDSPGLKVDPFVIVVLSLAFIGSIFFLQLSVYSHYSYATY